MIKKFSPTTCALKPFATKLMIIAAIFGPSESSSILWLLQLHLSMVTTIDKY